MMKSTTLVDEFHEIVDGYYSGSAYFVRVEEALRRYEAIMAAVVHDSLARDGMEMIELVMRDMQKESEDE